MVNELRVCERYARAPHAGRLRVTCGNALPLFTGDQVGFPLPAWPNRDELLDGSLAGPQIVLNIGAVAVQGGGDKDLVLIAGAWLMRAVCVSLARFMDCTVDDVLDERTPIVVLSNQ